ncbi:MAG: MBL fold metallo-hydrolase [Oscillospiraceae bacterium]|nr:MBL fold metallo-hydrolase [Oscillospiraceae bacterium]
MEMITLVLGELGTNCYILDCGNNQVVAIDIGGTPQKVLNILKTENLNLKAILLTHGHYDHVAGVESVRQATGAEVYIHEKDAIMLESGKANLAYQLSSEIYQPVQKYQVAQAGDILEIGNLEIQVMHTPGHTSGSVCYIIGNQMFCGDTIFKGSIGRTDLGGNVSDMKKSLQKIARLAQDYELYPGHFYSSTLAIEKKQNPYLRDFI